MLPKFNTVVGLDIIKRYKDVRVIKSSEEVVALFSSMDDITHEDYKELTAYGWVDEVDCMVKSL